MVSDPLFLGLDISTQQLKAVITDEGGRPTHHVAVQFDRDLPHHGTTNGAIQGSQGEVTSPVEMWLEAVDLLLERLRDYGVEFGRIRAVAGAAQQHGSVYWSTSANFLLSSLNPERSLADQLVPGAYSYLKAPIWQDSSTTEDCICLEEKFGGAQAVANRSGSRAYERFTGNQIARIRRLKPEVYEATSRISLVSSFVTSLFLGSIAPIEVADASGMNLMDILACKWDDRLMDICGGPSLRTKLGPEPVFGGTPLGSVNNWWVKRWGFQQDCIVAPFTGDNPATVVSLSASGDAILSLGTSTTFLLSVPPSDLPPRRATTSHLLAHPTELHGKIIMLCYKNGALAREQIRDSYSSGDWRTFNEMVAQTPPGCNGYMGFYFPLPEIIPPNVVGQYFFSTGSTELVPLECIPESVHPRAILESQFLSIRSRVVQLLANGSTNLHRLVLSGGGSANPAIRQLAADVFNADVYVASTEQAAAHGGALLARYAWKKQPHCSGSIGHVESPDLECVAKPRVHVTLVYDNLVDIHGFCENYIVQEKF